MAGVRRVFSARRWLLCAVLAVAVAGVIVAVVIVLYGSDRPRECGCKPPPDTSGISGVPREWRTAVARRDAAAAWRLLTPEAQRRYGSVKGLHGALARLALDAHGPADWRLLQVETQGRGTPSLYLYLLVEKRNLRAVGAVTVHTMADGSADGRVDPVPAATVRILEPAEGTTVDERPRLRAATASPLAYAVIRRTSETRGAVGSIRAPDGRDAPFYEALEPGPALIVAVDDSGGRLAYGGVRVTIR
ncbi:hypothetical protein [Actinomadura sp. WMMA1423]|uniref:hypothetical protein n=1 Tax=Actinomadura sp. WMMA1423 TaxID=2591108 RepID=UPI00143D0F2B|nr:hypothetical protein [Actinomadura sp. WMMA1423]